MSDQFSEEDLREARCFRHGDKSEQVKLGGCLVKECSYLGGVCDDCARIAAEFARIRSEARAGMREACAKYFEDKNKQKGHAITWHLILRAVVEDIRNLPDSAADEAIERIKREAHESGIREGASNEALLQRMFNEDGPVKIELERIKREARLEEARWWSRRTVTYGLDNGCASVEEEQQRIAALSGKET